MLAAAAAAAKTANASPPRERAKATDMMGMLAPGQSAMDELTAAAMGTRLKRKTRKTHVAAV